LLERSSSGVALTATGHALLAGMKPLIEKFDGVLADARRRARGQSSGLRIGYMPSAAAEFLHPALAALRKAHPEIKVRLLDLSPGEQIAALRRGEIDIALIGDPGKFIAREFYVRRIASLPVLVALADSHPQAGKASVKLQDLRNDPFVGAPDSDLPGHNRWIMHLCRGAGFRPKFVADADSLAHGLATVVSEGAVGLIPNYARTSRVPGVVFKPLDSCGAHWDLLVAWQRGRVSEPTKTILAHLPRLSRDSA
jgi:DNA-binding transcriptional LysR family regulator